MTYQEPLITRINRLMQELEESIDRVQEISVELENIVNEERLEQNDWK